MFFPDFRLIQSIFWSIEILFKIFSKPLPGSIDRTYFLINRTSWIKFFKKHSFDLFKHLFKTFLNFFSLSKTRQGSTEIFCHFPLKFLQSFSLLKSVCLFYPSFCIVFLIFMHNLMFFWVFFELCLNWNFWLIKPCFVNLINGFCSDTDVFMIYIG